MLTRRRLTYTLIALVMLASGRPAGGNAADPTVASGGVSLEAPLSREVFRALLQEEFSLLLANRAPTPLRLIRIDDDPARPGGGQFVVVFRGAPDLKLMEGTYRITHPTAGTTELYLRAKGRDDRSSYYEAPFNLLPPDAPVTGPPPGRQPRRFERPLYEPRR